MDPTGFLLEDQVSFLRYLERHGGYAVQPLLGLVAWQVAQAMDLLAIGATDGAKDCLSLLLLMLNHTAHDRGNSSLGWLLTLQADPPSNLFAAQTPMPGANLQSFSPLADQRWITTALAYAKELETIATRIAEGQPKQATQKHRQGHLLRLTCLRPRRRPSCQRSSFGPLNGPLARQAPPKAQRSDSGF